ncbi:MAG: glycerate kinase, partial [Sulfobacillus sp.]
ALARLSAMDWSGLDPRLATIELVALTDVDNPLTGEDGAARTFARQKGASPADIEILEQALCRFQDLVGGAQEAGGPGTGAAGGTGAALKLLGARLKPGSRSIMELINFAGQLATAQALITGEGRFDHQSLHGKAPAVALAAARAAAKPSCLIVGKRSIDLHEEDAASFVLELAPPHMALTEVRGQIQELFRACAEQATRRLIDREL